MKYEKLSIFGLPKTFNIWDACDSFQPTGKVTSPDDILIDMYPAECNEGEDASVLFEYDKSSTGVDLVYTPHLQTLSLWLSPWAAEADVRLYVKFVNFILSKYKRAKLYDKYAPLKCLTEDDENQMIKARSKYLERQLATKEGFTMEGLNAGYTLKVAHLKPADSLEKQAKELQNVFVEMQWTFDEEDS